MTCLLVSHTSDMNGAERSLLDLAVGLAAQGEDLLVLCPNEGPLTTCLREQDIPVTIMTLPRPRRHLLHLLKFILLWFAIVWKLTRLVLRRGVTVIYNNTIDGLYGPFAAWLTGIPCIWHIREVKPRSAQGRRLFSWLLTWLPTRAVFNSMATMRAYSVDSPAHWLVIYNGIEVPPLVPPDYSENESIVVGFVGQMAKHKRPERFLQAFARAKESVPDLHGMMAGDGILLGKMKSLAENLGITDQVEILGFVRSLSQFYSQLDILVLTSDREPFGRVLIEAMAAGHPVIAACVGGVPEVVEDGISGYLVPPDDIAAYAQKIVTLAIDPDLCSRMGAAGRQRVLEHFRLEHYLDNLVGLLHQITTVSVDGG